MTVATPLKYLVRINARELPENTDPDREFDYVDIGSVGRGSLVNEPTRMRFADAPSRARRIVHPGDTIVSTVRTYLRAVWRVPEDAKEPIVSTGFVTLTPGSQMDSRYLGWWAQAEPFIAEIVSRSVGVSYPAVSPSTVGEIRVPLNPLAQQTLIADFLDAETARIDAVIAKKEQLLQLMHERFRGILNQLFDELGDERAALGRFVTEITQGVSPQAGIEPAEGEEWGLLKLSAVKAESLFQPKISAWTRSSAST